MSLALLLMLSATTTSATTADGLDDSSQLVVLDFADAELAEVIETIARASNKNFIYDDRVRGRVTIIAPDPVPVEQAYAVFESVLHVKGFTTVETPGGAIKVVPLREAKESSIETMRNSDRPPNRDRFITQLISLHYIDADSIVNTLKPLVSNDAAMVAYTPTNTLILTESASSIRRLIAIIESIDIEAYREELAVISIEYADAATLAQQVSEIYGAELNEPATLGVGRPATRRPPTQIKVEQGAHLPPVRIVTDERTNSLLVLAPRVQLDEVRRLVAKLDTPARSGGRIHVYYLNHANAEELGETLSALVGSTSRSSPAAPSGSTGGVRDPMKIRSAVTGLAGGISVSVDPPTNSLVIQASQEGFSALTKVIEELDTPRPQVSVEMLILEVFGSDDEEVGFSGLLQAINGNSNLVIASATSSGASGMPGLPGSSLDPLVGQVVRDSRDLDASGNRVGSGSMIDAIINLAARSSSMNVWSAPHILTADNEEAEIRIGDNIPIITSRVESFQGLSPDPNLPNEPMRPTQQVNVERQDIGLTLRVTPRISGADQLHLRVFLEATGINSSLSVGTAEDVGVALTARRIESSALVSDGETIVFGGLIAKTDQESVTKVPWLGDVPILGWPFRSTSRKVVTQELMVFLTPRVMRTAEDLEVDTLRRREAFRMDSTDEADLRGEDLRLQRPAVERTMMQPVPVYFVQAAVLRDASVAEDLLSDLLNDGHDGTLISEEELGQVVYEIRIGPYSTPLEAQNAADQMERVHGLSPSLLVVESGPN